jgi:hypothetical protein
MEEKKRFFYFVPDTTRNAYLYSTHTDLRFFGNKMKHPDPIQTVMFISKNICTERELNPRPRLFDDGYSVHCTKPLVKLNNDKCNLFAVEETLRRSNGRMCVEIKSLQLQSNVSRSVHCGWLLLPIRYGLFSVRVSTLPRYGEVPPCRLSFICQ